MKTIAIIPAGGSGKRTGLDIPKQYIKVQEKEIIAYTLKIFQINNLVDEIIIAANREYFNLLNNIADKYSITKLTGIVEGGKERQDSVFNALSSINYKNPLIIVHDAARPLLEQQTLSNAIFFAKEKGNAVVAIKARDTLLQTNEKHNFGYLNREHIHYIQTPQIFYYNDLIKAFNAAHDINFMGTDESMLIKRIGHNINLVEGSYRNFKITTQDDIKLMQKLI